MLTVESNGEARLRFSEDGVPYTDIGMFVKTSFTAEGSRFLLTNVDGRSITLRGDSGPIAWATATKDQAFVEWASSRFELRHQRGPRANGWDVLQDGAQIGTIRSRLFRATIADLPRGLPLAIRTFLFYVAIAGGYSGPYPDTNHYYHS